MLVITRHRVARNFYLDLFVLVLRHDAIHHIRHILCHEIVKNEQGEHLANSFSRNLDASVELQTAVFVECFVI